MNMVNSIYSHVSLGYPVEIVLKRIIMLSNQVDKDTFYFENLLYILLV